MALRIRKDIKKSSYYVWFLGAKESKGLRGKEFILPVIEHLVQREKDIEPFKVTLQVSHKGLKIVQTVLSTNPKTAKPKNETIKHFIPHNTITCVYQDEDIVSCVLLLFNPVTKCPLHVHVYRCDSVETASLLRGQLETLIERPENQKKISDLESRIKLKEKKFDSSLGSDTGTSTRESESSEERYPQDNRITSLYDSLAAELRQKLGKTESPILLPPRDYDTVHRQKGNLQGIDMRRCLSTNIVGKNAKGTRIESSGGSSGIGSDHAPSPDSPDSPERYNNLLDNQSTSDEEWNVEAADSTHYLLAGQDMFLPRPSRHQENPKFSPEPPKSPGYARNYQERYLGGPRYQEEPRRTRHVRSGSKGYVDDFVEKEEIVPRPRYYHESPPRKYADDFDPRRPYGEKSRSKYPQEDCRHYQSKTMESPRKYNREDPRVYETRSSRSKYSQDDSPRSKYSEEYFNEPEIRRRPEQRQRSPSPTTPKDRFKDAKEKFLLLERTDEPVRHSVHHQHFKDKTFLKRHESMIHPKERYHDDRYQPKPAPRTTIPDEEVRYRRDPIPLDRYRDPRRSMYDQIEEEHKRNSNEIARELKRRSYMEEPEPRRYPERDYNYSKSTIELDKIDKYPQKYDQRKQYKQPAGYRHSYAEPKLSLERVKRGHHDMIQRTNSTVSNSGRVGIASVNPY